MVWLGTLCIAKVKLWVKVWNSDIHAFNVDIVLSVVLNFAHFSIFF